MDEKKRLAAWLMLQKKPVAEVSHRTGIRQEDITENWRSWLEAYGDIAKPMEPESGGQGEVVSYNIYQEESKMKSAVSNETWETIMRLIEEGKKMADLADEYNVSSGNISMVYKGWKIARALTDGSSGEDQSERIAGLEAELKEKTRMMAALSEDNYDLQNELHRVQSELEEALERGDGQEAETLRGALEIAKEEVVKAREERDQLSDRVRQLKETLEVQREKISETQKAQDDADDTAREAAKEAMESIRRREEAEAKLEEAARRLSELMDQLCEKEMELERYSSMEADMLMLKGRAEGYKELLGEMLLR